MSTTDLANLVTRLESVVQKLEKSATSGGGGSEEHSQFIEDYDNFISEFVDPYVEASAAVGDVVDSQAKELKAVADEQRKFLLVASKFSAPADYGKDFPKLAAAMSEHIGKVDSLKTKLDRKSNLVNHVRAACEGIGAFGWVAVPKTPMNHVKEGKDSAMFYTNKVLTEFKKAEGGAIHTTWVKAYINIFDGLRDYIKQHHTTGVSWNPKGSPATAASQASAPPPPPAIPTPPAPPAGTVNAPPAQNSAPPAGAVNALLADLSKGADVTKGLKRVTNDMKTHKNPELRKHHVPVPYKASPTTYKPMKKKPAKQTPVKPPKFALEGKKWVVENQEGAKLSIDECQMKQTVYIYKCNNTTISITQKVNSIVLDSCKKTGIVFSSVVSGVEVINSQSVQVQAQGKMHNVSIDKTDGCIVYLSKECLDAHIVTAKSSEMNVSIPKDDGDFDEYPIVEQFRTYWNADKKTFVTVPSEQLG